MVNHWCPFSRLAVFLYFEKMLLGFTRTSYQSSQENPVSPPGTGHPSCSSRHAACSQPPSSWTCPSPGIRSPSLLGTQRPQGPLLQLLLVDGCQPPSSEGWKAMWGALLVTLAPLLATSLMLLSKACPHVTWQYTYYFLCQAAQWRGPWSDFPHFSTSQGFNNYLCLLFFLLIILWVGVFEPQIRDGQKNIFASQCLFFLLIYSGRRKFMPRGKFMPQHLYKLF